MVELVKTFEASFFLKELVFGVPVIFPDENDANWACEKYSVFHSIKLTVKLSAKVVRFDLEKT